MSLRLIVRPEAEADALEAALWYEGREPGLGLEVTAELHSAIGRARENPLAYLLLRKQPQRHALWYQSSALSNNVSPFRGHGISVGNLTKSSVSMNVPFQRVKPSNY